MNEILAQNDQDWQDPTPEMGLDLEDKNYLEELVGDDKKFKSVEDLAKGKAQSDHYIKTLESRLDEMREDYLKVREENMAGPKLQELIDKLETLQRTGEAPPKAHEEKASAIDPKAVEDLVHSAVQRNEQIRREQENYNLVMNKLRDRFGSDYESILKRQAKELDMSIDEVNTMAKKNPNLFSKTFDLNSQKPVDFQAPPRGKERSDNFAPRAPEKRTWSYYQQMRKKDPQAWLDPKIAVQMEKDSQALGKDFFDT